MKNIINICIAFLTVTMFAACESLTEINENPNGVSPIKGNLNLMLPGIITKTSYEYFDVEDSYTGGLMQHMQKDGWFTEYNSYLWYARDWNSWYEILTNVQLLIENSEEENLPFHEGIGYLYRGLIFGNITDLWGEAPYSEALEGETGIVQPKFDAQEEIYRGVLEDLEKAAELFDQNNTVGMINANDILFQGDIQKWHQYANTLRLRYAMRLSEKLPDLTEQVVSSVFSSDVFMKDVGDDANVEFLGNTKDDSWSIALKYDSEEGSNFRRRKPAQTLIDKLRDLNDPRLFVWVDSVHVQWVEDNTLGVKYEDFVRKDGAQQSYLSMSDAEYKEEINKGHKFTRRFNPNSITLDTSLYVGLPTALSTPSAHNENPTPGQSVQNQHVSQLAEIYREASGGILKRRMATSAETYFCLAEAALKGWIQESVETLFKKAIENSFGTWEIPDEYDSYISSINTNNLTLEDIMEQKWISGWTNSVETWMDYRRLGLPDLQTGPDADEAALPIRFIYGDKELAGNKKNIDESIDRGLEETAYSKVRGKNSQWSKPWLLQGTGKPW